VNCLTFSPDSQLLASGHRDGTILIWDAARAGGNSGHSKVIPSQEQWRADNVVPAGKSLALVNCTAVLGKIKSSPACGAALPAGCGC
jgi:WD40 repeat protein